MKGEVTGGINLRNEHSDVVESRRIAGVTGVSANYFRSRNFLLRTVGPPSCLFGINVASLDNELLNDANET